MDVRACQTRVDERYTHVELNGVEMLETLPRFALSHLAKVLE